jgi:hypothetical protein
MVYPYEEQQRGGNSEDVLKGCYRLSYAFMSLLEPLGQASSSYEDTGDPERIALGIRAFLSSTDNLHMLRDIGEGVLEHLTTLGSVGEFIRKFGGHNDDQNKQDAETLKNWDQIKIELEKTDKRSYDVVMSGVNEYMKKFKGKSTKKELCKKCGLPTKMCICKEVETSVNAHKSKVMDDLKKKAIEKSRK